MAAIDGGISGELSYYCVQTVLNVCIAAALEVGTTNAHPEQRVAREGHLLFCAVEGDAARGMTGGGEHLELMLTKGDHLLWGEIMPGGGIGTVDADTRHGLELLGDIRDEPLIRC